MATIPNTLIHGLEARMYARTVKMFRTLADASPQDLASASGLHYHTIMRAERGRVCSTAVLTAVSAALHLDMATLIEFANAIFGRNELAPERRDYLVKYLRHIAKKGIKHVNNDSVQNSNPAGISGSPALPVQSVR